MRSSEPKTPGIAFSLVDVVHDVPVNLKVEHSNQTSPYGEALQAVLTKVEPIIDETLHNDTVAFHVIGAANLKPPLTINEVIVLACAIVCASRGAPLTSNEVLDLTDQIRGRPMNLKSIYNSIDGLRDRGLLLEGEPVLREHTGRPSKSYKVTDAGRKIFAIAASYDHQLVKACSQTAA